MGPIWSSPSFVKIDSLLCDQYLWHDPSLPRSKVLIFCLFDQIDHLKFLEISIQVLAPCVLCGGSWPSKPPTFLNSHRGRERGDFLAWYIHFSIRFFHRAPLHPFARPLCKYQKEFAATTHSRAASFTPAQILPAAPLNEASTRLNYIPPRNWYD